MGSLLFSLESSYTWDFMYFPRVEFLIPQVLWKSCNQTLLAFKARFSGHSTCCSTPRLRSLTWGSELSLLWDNFCGIIIFWFVGGPSGGYGNWFYHDTTPLTRFLWLLFCFWMQGIFWGGGRFQHFWLVVVQQLWFWCFCKKKVSSHPSTPSSWDQSS